MTTILNWPLAYSSSIPTNTLLQKNIITINNQHTIIAKLNTNFTTIHQIGEIM
ncbi:hypothetical protein M2408_002108 [Sphingobacterium sp. BIGb0165]|nr:hypothetical protein [Sphingobacterium sp. BIGb0165]